MNNRLKLLLKGCIFSKCDFENQIIDLIGIKNDTFDVLLDTHSPICQNNVKYSEQKLLSKIKQEFIKSNANQLEL
jgi:hypothetical protein